MVDMDGVGGKVKFGSKVDVILEMGDINCTHHSSTALRRVYRRFAHNKGKGGLRRCKSSILATPRFSDILAISFEVCT
jgi:hypothetical protein